MFPSSVKSIFSSVSRRSLLVLLGVVMSASCVLGADASAPTTAASEVKAEKVVLVGDSTVASGSGWGDAFGKLLKPGVVWENLAIGGRSSKSYRDEGHWKKVQASGATWVLIQFGHNDQPGKGPARETDAKTTFRENLARYVNEVRAMGAKPVLVTSLTRRNFDTHGKIVAGELEVKRPDGTVVKYPEYLADYVEGTKAVAAELKVPLIDLNARSIAQMNEMGPEAAVAFDAASKDPTKPDKTHLSAKGAEETAKLVADEVRGNVGVEGLAGLLR